LKISVVAMVSSARRIPGDRQHAVAAREILRHQLQRFGSATTCARSIDSWPTVRAMMSRIAAR
jgi:hypothetical protein